MPAPPSARSEVEIVVFDGGTRQCALTFTGPFEVGRQRKVSENLYTPYAVEPGRTRLVVARTTEDNVGRQHGLVELLGNNRIRISNLSNVQPIWFEQPAGPPLMPGEKRDVGLPQLVRLGPARVLRLQVPNPGDDGSMAGLAGATLPPGAARTSRLPRLDDPDALVRREDMVEWFAGILDLQAKPAGSDEYFNRIAKSLIEVAGLDSGRVLLREQGEWKQRSIQIMPQQLARPFRPPSQTLLQKVLTHKRTFWESPATQSSAPESVAGLEGVVAAPILDTKGEVIGALYGDREPRLTPMPGASGPISRLEAMLVELLAKGVAAGLARLEAERDNAQAITLFEQFFTPKLARSLAQTPDWEKARKAEITVLFADICRFTAISGKLEPQQTFEWVRDVLDMMSACVLDNGGVLVDYVGDAVMAMWGAPEDMADHAGQACQAAMDMLERLPELNEKWAITLGAINERTELAIGLNSGPAQVGNVGSKFKFKYGAQGPVVNLGSRVQGANKFFRSHVLMTSHTYEKLSNRDEFNIRRLADVELNNVAEAVRLYELKPHGSPDWPGWRDEYSKALDLFERKLFQPAARILAIWRDLHQEDGPALMLLARAVSAVAAGKTPENHPIVVLEKK